MQSVEQMEMVRRKDDLVDTMENHFARLAPIEELPIPPSVLSSPSFKKAGLAKIVRSFGVMGYKIPGVNGKLLAALKILLALAKVGILTPDLTLIAATSGNFGYAMAMLTVSLVRIFQIKEFVAVVESTTSEGKKFHLRRSGATIVVAPVGMTAIEYADQLGRQSGYYTVNQYTDINNVLAQEWLANAVYGAFGDKLSMFGLAVGSTASFVGAHRFLRPLVGSHLKIIGAASMPDKKEKVPGSRSEAEIVKPGFDYQCVPDYKDYPLVANVSKHEAFAATDEYIKMSKSFGVTGGLASAASFEVIEAKLEAGRLSDLMNEDGNIVLALWIVDMFLPYSQEMYAVLDAPQ